MRTHYCGQVDARLIDQEVTLCGWAHRRRDHGGVIFVDLRDRAGIAQIVCDPDRADMFRTAESVRNEFCLRVSGRVRARPPGTVNVHIASGEIEILCHEMEVLNPSLTPPFQIDEENLSENTRLLHRVIDLRRPQMQKNMLLRYRTARAFRRFLDDAGFIDRQPEFTQVDIETSFMDEGEIIELMEELIRTVFAEVMAVHLPRRFPRLSHREAMLRYGSDKPDLRVTLELVEVSDVLRDVPFKVFAHVANSEGGRIAALRVPGGASLTRGEIDAYTQFVGIYGARGLAYIKVNDVSQLNETGLQSPIVKNLHAAALQAIIERTGATSGDLVFFGADRRKVVDDALGALRVRIGHEKGFVNGNAWEPVWIVDFPMFEYDDGERRWNACHHPFTSPKEEHLELLASDPGRCLAKAYDLALNGSELGGGSVRIHRAAVQEQVFQALGISDEEARSKFGFLLDALKYGAPPHGGLAFGLDRIVTMMAGAESIRDVIAFPKTQRAQCLLTDAPSGVDERQLRELHIRLRQRVDTQVEIGKG